jgi:HlyD family secretion protein
LIAARMDSKLPSLDALRIDRQQAPQRSRGLVVDPALAVGRDRSRHLVVHPPQAITVQTATRSNADDSGSAGGKTLLNASGYVTTRLEATVSSKITGKVAEILIEEGMKVEKDQILAKLDASNVRPDCASRRLNSHPPGLI